MTREEMASVVEAVLQCADNLAYLRPLLDESMMLIVTSPPYNLGKSYERREARLVSKRYRRTPVGFRSRMRLIRIPEVATRARELAALKSALDADEKGRNK